MAVISKVINLVLKITILTKINKPKEKIIKIIIFKKIWQQNLTFFCFAHIFVIDMLGLVRFCTEGLSRRVYNYKFTKVTNHYI